MQQTSLNLIALGIFAMTLFSLLGPLFNVSPAVPAVLTFSILGLATLDSLTLQGKAASILLDWLARASPQYRERVIRHEAGHFLVAHLLEIPITGYTLSGWETLKKGIPGQGGVIFDVQKLQQEGLSPWEIKLTVDRFCTVWMAGIAAETLVYNSVEGGAEDRQKLRQTLVQLGSQPSELLPKERSSQLQAQTLIQENWTAYEALVKAMEQRTSVEECCQLIEQHQLKLT